MDAGYIGAAKKRFAERGTFICKKVSRDALEENVQLNLVLAKGVLHHLNDLEAADMFDLARTHLTKGGRLIPYDECCTPGQGLFSKSLLTMDRGNFVRTKDEYLNLAGRSFSIVKSTHHQDLMRIPYTILIMECVT